MSNLVALRPDEHQRRKLVHGEACLLGEFAPRGFLKRLARFDAPAGEGVVAERGGAAAQHEIRGRIEAIPRERVSVTLTHDEIPGVMAAMRNMEYGIADPAILDGLAAGDSVEGRLEARSGGYVIVALRKR